MISGALINIAIFSFETCEFWYFHQNRYFFFRNGVILILEPNLDVFFWVMDSDSNDFTFTASKLAG